jgi:ParB-like chromosome segregation protein Spo0J
MSTAALNRPRTLTEADVEMVRISDIEVGIRRRKSIGGLSSLMKSIEAHGLIHPILLRNGNQLVAGGRRLAACEKLGRQYIAARTVDGMSDEELRAIEEEENRERAGLNDFDSSKARLSEIRQAEADLKRAADRPELRGDDPRNSKKGRGRPSEAGSQRHVAAVTGIAPKTQREIASHVEIAEQYPALQRPGWVQHQVLNAGVLLEKLPEADRPKAAALLDQDAIPPKTALGILENLTTLPTPERKDIFKQAESENEFERRTALTRAAALPPPVDPGLTLLGDVVAAAKKAAKHCHAVEFKSRISTLADEASALLGEFSKWNEKQRGRA